MNDARYKELLGLLLDGELSSAEAEELAAGLRSRPELRKDLQDHLLLWETWSQQRTPERTSESFLAAWQTRRRVEAQSDPFSQETHERLVAEAGRGWSLGLRVLWWRLRRPSWIAAVSIVLLLLGIALWWGYPSSGRAEVVTIAGEGVCPRCTLHESEQHSMAVRISAGAEQRIVYLRTTNELARLQRNFCMGPTPVTAKGVMQKQTAKPVLLVWSIELAR